jgi:hypothetical protein
MRPFSLDPALQDLRRDPYRVSVELTYKMNMDGLGLECIYRCNSARR